MPKVTKIQIAHLISTGNDLFAVDNEGRVWKRRVDSPEWSQEGEVPDEPVAVEHRDQLVIDAPAGLEEEGDKRRT
jgi:hypothetical protein